MIGCNAVVWHGMAFVSGVCRQWKAHTGGDCLPMRKSRKNISSHLSFNWNYSEQTTVSVSTEAHTRGPTEGEREGERENAEQNGHSFDSIE